MPIRDNNLLPTSNQGEGQEASEGESDTTDISKRNSKKSKKKSGMVAKPTDHVKSQEVWPHMNVIYSY